MRRRVHTHTLSYSYSILFDSVSPLFCSSFLHFLHQIQTNFLSSISPSNGTTTSTFILSYCVLCMQWFRLFFWLTRRCRTSCGDNLPLFLEALCLLVHFVMQLFGGC
eukprot:727029_1